jgi:hypothetical protein
MLLYRNDLMFLYLRRSMFTARYKLNLQIQFRLTFALENVPWLRWLVANLLKRNPQLNPRSFHVRFVVDRVAMGQDFLRLLRFPPVSIIPSMIHTHLHLRVAFVRRTNKRSLETFEKTMFFSEIGKHWIEKHFFYI